MSKKRALIYVVDDDRAVRRATSRMLRASGFSVQSYESGLTFLIDAPFSSRSCLLLDIRMPGMTGIEVVEHMVKNGIAIPTILMTAHGDLHSWEEKRKPVLACLQKPIDEKRVLALIEEGLAT